MADRKVQIELQITANAQQAKQVLAGLGRDARGGGGGSASPGGLNLGALLGGGEGAEGAAAAGGTAAAVAGGFVVAALVLKKALGAMRDAVVGFTQASINLSKIANPAAATLYDLAARDLYGVIGQKLTPVVEIATDAVRMFGDFLASVLPNSKEIRAALAPLKDALKSITTALAAAVPVVRLVFERILLGVARSLAFVAGVLEGLFGSGGTLPNSARGAATRPAQIFGDLNSAIEAMNVAALSGASVEEQSAGYLKNIDENVAAIRDAINSARQFGKNAADIATGNTQGWGWLGDFWWGAMHPAQSQGQYFFGSGGQ